MGMFNMAVTTGLKESGKVLSAGIHNATFKSISFENFTAQNGASHEVMNLVLDVEGFGEWTKRFFNPAIKNGVEDPSAAERTTSQYGENPSRIEQFMISLRQIIDALDLEIGQKLDTGKVDVNGKIVDVTNLGFSQLVKLVGVLTAPYAGKVVEIKLVPSSTGFNDFPGFPGKINRAGQLGIASRFIGSNLVLSQSEIKKIDMAKNSTPTNMATSNATLDGVADALGISDSDSDLPF